MLVRPAARPDQPSPYADSRLRPAGGTPVARGVAAAVLAVAALVTAANVGPARAATLPATVVVQQPGHP